MLLKKPENETPNERDENIEDTKKLNNTLASTYSKKFETHFSISPTSSKNQQQQKLFLKKTFPSTITTTVLMPTFPQKKVLTVSSPASTTPIQKNRANTIAKENLNIKNISSVANNNNNNKNILTKLSNVLIQTTGENNLNVKAICICNRPHAMVICKRCGNEIYGRVQRICIAHPKRICLMDQRECVNSFCRNVHLSEINLQ